jgi:hypothetical protein
MTDENEGVNSVALQDIVNSNTGYMEITHLPNTVPALANVGVVGRDIKTDEFLRVEKKLRNIDPLQ